MQSPVGDFYQIWYYWSPHFFTEIEKMAGLRLTVKLSGLFRPYSPANVLASQRVLNNWANLNSSHVWSRAYNTASQTSWSVLAKPFSPAHSTAEQQNEATEAPPRAPVILRALPTDIEAEYQAKMYKAPYYVQCLEWLEHVEANGYKPTKALFRIAVQACKKSQKYLHVLHLYDTMLEEGEELDLGDFHEMLKACEALRMWETSVGIIKTMQDKNVEPTCFSYASVIRACETSGQPKRGLEYFNIAKKKKNYNGNQYLFVAAIKCCVGSVDKAKQLFKNIADEKMHPTAASYEALMYVYYYSGCFAQGVELYRHTFLPNAQTPEPIVKKMKEENFHIFLLYLRCLVPNAAPPTPLIRLPPTPSPTTTTTATAAATSTTSAAATPDGPAILQEVLR